MARAFVAAIAFLLLVLPAAAQAPESGFYEVNGIEYYYATGPYGRGHFTLGADDTGADQEPFTGCSWAKLRPDNNKGRVQVLGTWYEQPFIVDISDFPESNQTPDSIAPGAPVSADASGLGQEWPSTMTASSMATIDVGNVPLIDPVSGNPNFTATWFVTPTGFRDDASGLLDIDGPAGAAEMHMRVSSSGPKQGPTTWQVNAPEDGLSYLPPEDGYVELYAIPNERLGGTGVLQAEASSLALPGANALLVTAYAPDGTFLGSLNLTPDAVQPDSDGLEFPLDQFGSYYVTVEGTVSLARYQVSLEQRTPDAFEMDFWWDEVLPGHAGLEARQACSDELGGPVMEAFVAPRPPPTAFDWTFSLMAVAAGLVLLVLTVALVVSAYNHAVARRAVRD